MARMVDADVGDVAAAPPVYNARTAASNAKYLKDYFQVDASSPTAYYDVQRKIVEKNESHGTSAFFDVVTDNLALIFVSAVAGGAAAGAFGTAGTGAAVAGEGAAAAGSSAGLYSAETAALFGDAGYAGTVASVAAETAPVIFPAAAATLAPVTVVGVAAPTIGALGGAAIGAGLGASAALVDASVGVTQLQTVTITAQAAATPAPLIFPAAAAVTTTAVITELAPVTIPFQATPPPVTPSPSLLPFVPAALSLVPLLAPPPASAPDPYDKHFNDVGPGDLGNFGDKLVPTIDLSPSLLDWLKNLLPSSSSLPSGSQLLNGVGTAAGLVGTVAGAAGALEQLLGGGTPRVDQGTGTTSSSSAAAARSRLLLLAIAGGLAVFLLKKK